MQAGLLKHIITFEQPVVIEDDYGANSVEWQFYKTTRASVKEESGNRANENNEIVFNYNVKFTVRHFHNLSENMRIIWKNRKYRILNIFPDDNIQRIEITTELINE